MMNENNKNLEEIIAEGALVIDVRTPGEYKDGHIKGSLNIPMNDIKEAMSWLIKDAPIIVCCASGSRSAEAKKILEANGYEKVYNGGSWNDLGKFKVGSCPIK